MHNKRKQIIFLGVMGAFLLWIIALSSLLFQAPSSGQIILSLSSASSLTSSMRTVPFATPRSHIQKIGTDSGLIIELISLGTTTLGTIAAAFIAIRQLRNNARLERQNRALKAEMASSQHEGLHIEQARRHDELTARYRERLSDDPHIAFLPLPYLGQPLDIRDIYVNLRVQRHVLTERLDDDPPASTVLHEPYSMYYTSHYWRDHHTTSIMDLEQAVLTYKRCILLGDSGSGKTTVLRYLTLKAAKRQLRGLSDLPVYVELGAFACSDEDELTKFVAKKWQDEYGIIQEEALSYLEKKLVAGGVLLLLDGFDETYIGLSAEVAEKTHLRVYNAIRQITHNYSQVFIVVTAGKSFYRQLVSLPGFTELELLKFRQQDIEQFVENWLACLSGTQKNPVGFSTLLQQDTRVCNLATNPLQLSLLVMLYVKDIPLPAKRCTLYKAYIETLYAEREVYHHDGYKHNQQKQRLLAQIAWHMHAKRQYLLDQNDFHKVLTSFLLAEGMPPGHTSEMLTNYTTMLVEEGWLKEQAYGRYSFPHFSLQEYFTTQYLIIHHMLLTFIHSRTKESWWSEVALFYAGLSDRVEELAYMLVENDDKREFSTHESLILAGRCWISVGRFRTSKLEERLQASLVQLLTETRYVQLRQQAAEILISVERDHVDTLLLSLLSNQQFPARKQLSIAQALGTARTTLLLQHSLALLKNELIDSVVRTQIAQALSRSGLRSIVGELISLLTSQHLHADVRTSIAIAIGELGDAVTARKLASQLANKQLDLSVRITIVEALGVLGEHTVLFDLQKLYADPQTEFALRWRVAIAMALSGHFSAASSLIPLFSHSEYPQDTLLEIAYALGTPGIQSLAFDLLPLLAKESIAWEVRASVAHALEGLGERAIIPQLVELFAQSSIHPYVRISICLALAALEERPLLHALREVHIEQASEPLVWRTLCIVQGKYGESMSAQQLLLWLTDDEISESERLYILDALSMLREPEIVPKLLQLLSTPAINKKKLLRKAIIAALTLLAQDQTTIEMIWKQLGRISHLLPEGEEDLYAARWELRHRLLGVNW